MNTARRPVVLIGPRAVGKSTVGRLLARELALPFIDLDERIEERSGCSVAELLNRDGEARLRRLELGCLREALGAPCVVAAGGGVVEGAEACALLCAAATCIGLLAPVDVLAERIRRDGGARKRPPLLGVDPVAEIGALLARRLESYRDLSVAVWSTAHRAAPEIATEIAEYLQGEEES